MKSGVLFWRQAFTNALLLFVLSWTGSAQAHDTNLAHFTVQTGERIRIDVKFHQGAAHEELFRVHQARGVLGRTRAQYEEMVVEYLMKRLHVSVNEQQLPVVRGPHKITRHQSRFTAYVNHEADEDDEIDIALLAFHKRPHQAHRVQFLDSAGDIVLTQTLSSRSGFRTRLPQVESDDDDDEPLPHLGLLLGFAVLLVAAGGTFYFELKPQRA